MCALLSQQASPFAHLAAHEHGVGCGRDLFIAVEVALWVVRKGAVERADLMENTNVRDGVEYGWVTAERASCRARALGSLGCIRSKDLESQF